MSPLLLVVPFVHDCTCTICVCTVNRCVTICYIICYTRTCQVLSVPGQRIKYRVDGGPLPAAPSLILQIPALHSHPPSHVPIAALKVGCVVHAPPFGQFTYSSFLALPPLEVHSLALLPFSHSLTHSLHQQADNTVLLLDTRTISPASSTPPPPSPPLTC